MEENQLEVAGTIGIFKSKRTTLTLIRRHAGFWRFNWVFQFVSYVFVFVLSIMIPAVFLGEPWIGFPASLSFVIVSVTCLKWENRLADRRIGRRQLFLEIPDELNMSYRVTREGLRSASQAGFGITYWPTINAVELVKSDWLIFVFGVNAYVIPRSFFSSTDAEYAFIKSVLGYLTPSALARSQRAEKFLSSLSVSSH
jgi:hypothetical protein